MTARRIALGLYLTVVVVAPPGTFGTGWLRLAVALSAIVALLLLGALTIKDMETR